MTTSNWRYFLGNGESKPLTEVPKAPAWRQFMTQAEFEGKEKGKSEEKAEPEEKTKPKASAESEKSAELSASKASLERWEKLRKLAEQDSRGKERGESFRLNDAYKVEILNAVNAAIHLRRPLLVTGKPGSGKTSLAFAVAHELQLGAVLSWPITARSILQDALFRYDAVARLQDVNLKIPDRDMGEYIRLGPVGTAFLPSHLPRVLLIDEIDKCDINLPNDLLNLFEEGWYEIPELVRCKKEMAEVTVRTADTDVFARIKGGRVQCYEFPFVVMTSNGERDFPPAFLRRCLRLRMPDPSQNQPALQSIVEAHLQKGEDKKQWTRIQREITEIVREFVARGEGETEDIATDQLLNVVYLLTREVKPEGDAEEIKKLKNLLLKKLSED